MLVVLGYCIIWCLPVSCRWWVQRRLIAVVIIPLISASVVASPSVVIGLSITPVIVAIALPVAVASVIIRVILIAICSVAIVVLSSSSATSVIAPWARVSILSAISRRCLRVGVSVSLRLLYRLFQCLDFVLQLLELLSCCCGPCVCLFSPLLLCSLLFLLHLLSNRWVRVREWFLPAILHYL